MLSTIRIPHSTGTIDVSTVVAFDTGRWETCIFAEGHFALARTLTAATLSEDMFAPQSDVVAWYSNADDAATGHRSIVAAVAFAVHGDLLDRAELYRD